MAGQWDNVNGEVSGNRGRVNGGRRKSTFWRIKLIGRLI